MRATSAVVFGWLACVAPAAAQQFARTSGVAAEPGTVSVRVVDRYGLPVESATLRGVASRWPLGSPFASAPFARHAIDGLWTDADGRVVFALEPGVDASVLVERSRYAPCLAYPLRSGAHYELELSLGRTVEIQLGGDFQPQHAVDVALSWSTLNGRTDWIGLDLPTLRAGVDPAGRARLACVPRGAHLVVVRNRTNGEQWSTALGTPDDFGRELLDVARLEAARWMAPVTLAWRFASASGAPLPAPSLRTTPHDLARFCDIAYADGVLTVGPFPATLSWDVEAAFDGHEPWNHWWTGRTLGPHAAPAPSGILDVTLAAAPIRELVVPEALLDALPPEAEVYRFTSPSRAATWERISRDTLAEGAWSVPVHGVVVAVVADGDRVVGYLTLAGDALEYTPAGTVEVEYAIGGNAPRDVVVHVDAAGASAALAATDRTVRHFTRRFALSDATGRLVLEGLLPATYLLEPHFHQVPFADAIHELEIAPGRAVHVAKDVPRGCSVTVRVIERVSGKPIGFGQLNVFGLASTVYSFDFPVGPSGAVHVGGLRPGEPYAVQYACVGPGSLAGTVFAPTIRAGRIEFTAVEGGDVVLALERVP